MSVFGKVIGFPWLSTSFSVGRYSVLRCAAVYGGPLGVRVNAVAPGIIPTNLLGRPEETSVGSAGTTARARNAPMRRVGTTDEVASLVAFLLSDEAAFLSGGVHSVDGYHSIDTGKYGMAPCFAIEAADRIADAPSRPVVAEPAREQL